MSGNLAEKIRQQAHILLNDVIAIRRHIHAHPELSFQEKETSAYIQSILRSWDVPFKTGFANHGIVAILDSGKPGKTIAMRADMDALPIHEKTSHDFRSLNHGVMHACGHDAHTASLLGVIRILQHLRDTWQGKMLFLFQPAEELAPGGAQQMLLDGALDNPAPDYIIGQHVMPGMETGKIGMRPGIYMASSDEIYLRIHGKGGHAAMPHLINDTVAIAAQIIVNLQQIASRFAPAHIPTVLSFGRVIADGANNVIPSEVSIDGTFRTMDESWRMRAKDLIRTIAQSTAESMGASCEVEIRKGYPVLINDEALTAKAQQAAREFLGEEQLEELDIRMTAEDFAYYGQRFPACFYRLGIHNETKGIIHPLHSAAFDLDEDSLLTGMSFMAYLACNLTQ